MTKTLISGKGQEVAITTKETYAKSSYIDRYRKCIPLVLTQFDTHYPSYVNATCINYYVGM